VDFRFFVFTNDPSMARRAVAAGSTRIVVDLEIMGKAERQVGRDTVISRHTPKDVSRLREIVPTGSLVARVNPLWDGSAAEIEDVVARGADHVMLPMWRTTDELSRFSDLLRGRAHAIPLLETRAAGEAAAKALSTGVADEVHIGLTDLHLEYRMRFLFEVLADGILDDICSACRTAGVTYGFGGVGRVGRPGNDMLPPEWVLLEHERLGSTGVILSRSFLTDVSMDMSTEVSCIRGVLAAARERTFPERVADRARASQRIREVANMLATGMSQPSTTKA
jgi:hypothetical protein